MNIAPGLQKLLTSKGISRSRFAKAIGVHTSTVSNWLDGKDVKSENLASICSYFGVSIEDLSNSDAPEQTKKPAGEIPDELKDTDYALLNDQNKDLIKAMIATLYKQQSGE